NKDYLDFDYLAKILEEIINNETLLPASIGIYGDWGSGKSSLMEICRMRLEAAPEILCIKFNGWLFEGYEDAKSALIGTILDTIAKQEKLSSKAKGLIKKLYTNTDKLKLVSKGLKYGTDIFLSGGIGTLADITLSKITDTIRDKISGADQSQIEDYLKKNFESEELRNDIKSFHADFETLIGETKLKTVVVFIDELDRCNTETVLATLEAIRLFLFAKNTAFVIGADERHVIHAVRKKFFEIEGKEIDIGKEYLEKLVQYPIRIPQLGQKEVEFYILSLFLEIQLDKEKLEKALLILQGEKANSYFDIDIANTNIRSKITEIDKKAEEAIFLAKQISNILANGLKGNPRHCKRFLNTMIMREKMAVYKNITLDRKILAKIMLLEYFKVGLYTRLSSLVGKTNGKPEELALLEKKDWSSLGDLKLWENDPWVLEWIDTRPNLTNTDLRPYFYFTREKFGSRDFIGKMQLSPNAETCLNALFDGSDTGRKKAINMAGEVNDAEANTILEKIGNLVITEDKIEINNFKALLEWGATKESLYSTAIQFIKGINGKKINISFIPVLANFYKTVKRSDVIDVTSKWKTENNSLIKAIEKNFEGLH
ncbi:MAG: KAP family NTPase, partial [Spirochaetota bacterium]|nr:KAP family NTPase [Spirochaetota bacterium]